MKNKLKLGLYFDTDQENYALLENSNEDGFDYKLTEIGRTYGVLVSINFNSQNKEAFTYAKRLQGEKCLMIQPIYESWHEAVKGILGKDYKTFKDLLKTKWRYSEKDIDSFIKSEGKNSIAEAFGWHNTLQGIAFWKDLSEKLTKTKVGEL